MRAPMALHRQADRAFDQMDAELVDGVRSFHHSVGRSVLVGLCGPQGSGKSSTAARLVKRLEQFGDRAVACSIDDFYLAKETRLNLARQVHPLLATRGPPGTHDVKLLGATLDQLLRAGNATCVPLPAFDKTRDDRVPTSEWSSFRGKPDVVILEGWCVGAWPQSVEAISMPVNDLERLEDPTLVWRRFVNHELETSYADLFTRLDLLYLFTAPSFDVVFDWRLEQETGLARPADGSRPPMLRRELHHFLAHYERLTRWIMADEPGDVVVDLTEKRRPCRIRFKEKTSPPNRRSSEIFDPKL